MNYPDNRRVCIGDLIWWNEGTCLGYVSEIIGDLNEVKHRGLDDMGIFISNDYTKREMEGSMYVELSDFEDEGISKCEIDEHRYLDEVISKAFNVLDDFRDRSFFVQRLIIGDERFIMISDYKVDRFAGNVLLIDFLNNRTSILNGKDALDFTHSKLLKPRFDWKRYR